MKGFVYIMTNKNNTVLYTGVTSNLRERVIQHKEKKHPDSFSVRYNTFKLVYFESLDTIGEAIQREKQIKPGSRKAKVELINKLNPKWDDLCLLLEAE
jgi:putative endonuclease